MAACPGPIPGSAASPILAGESGILRPHPKSGERRRVRQPLRLDRLPLALRDRIRAERAGGHTWDEIERASPQWPEWEQATPEVLAAFPGRRLPHSNMQRWHDLRVEQVQREREGQDAAAQAFAARLGALRIDNLGAAVKDALGQSVFRLALEGADEQLVRDELCRLARVITAVDRDEIVRERLELERQKHQLAVQQAHLAQEPEDDPEPEDKDAQTGAPGKPDFGLLGWNPPRPTTSHHSLKSSSPAHQQDPDDELERDDNPGSDDNPDSNDEPGPEDEDAETQISSKPGVPGKLGFGLLGWNPRPPAASHHLPPLAKTFPARPPAGSRRRRILSLNGTPGIRGSLSRCSCRAP